MLTVNRLHQTNLPTWQHLTAATLCAQTQQQSAVCCWWQPLAIGAVWPQVQLLHWFLSVIKWEEQFTPLCYSYTVGLQSVAPCSRWFWIMHLPFCNTGRSWFSNLNRATNHDNHDDCEKSLYILCLISFIYSYNKIWRTEGIYGAGVRTKTSYFRFICVELRP